MNSERDRLLAEVARRYYLRDQSQQEIADQLGISRSNISRILTEARRRGIVEIRIHHPIGRNTLLEQQILELFHLREVGVVGAVLNDSAATLDQVALLAGQMLEELLTDGQTLGISWGTTLNAIAHAFAPQRRYEVEVVQMMGGVGSNDPTTDGPALAQRLAQNLSGKYRYLYAPLIVDSPETAQSLYVERSIAETLAVAAQSDIALVGIGAVDPSTSSLMRAGYLTASEFQAIQADGVVGDICGRHFNLNGKLAAHEIAARTISVTLEQIAHIPTVVGVACGITKARAMYAALRGDYLDVLVTDSATAELVLAMATATKSSHKA